jgi:hypothetical protein
MLAERIAVCRLRRPEGSDSHFVTLIGIALKAACPAALAHLVSDSPLPQRVLLLERVVEEHAAEIDTIAGQRQNSFTGARRFLGPQVLLSAYFAKLDLVANFADLGTGLGILPRQLGCRPVYERFASGLRWPQGIPGFQPVRLLSRTGVDRGPLPDLAWVRSCYGPSAYYDRLFRELVEAIELTAAAGHHTRVVAVDLLDTPRLVRFLQHHRINAVNLSYVLYEFTPAVRSDLIDTLLCHLEDPKFIIVTEPNEDLARRGCRMVVYDRTGNPRSVGAVSDGHFLGEVRPLDDFEWYFSRYPISVPAREPQW